MNVKSDLRFIKNGAGFIITIASASLCKYYYKTLLNALGIKNDNDNVYNLNVQNTIN